MAADSIALGPAPPQAGRAAALTTAGLAAMLFWLLVGDLGIAVRERAALPSGLELLHRSAASDTTTSLMLSTVPAILSLLLVPFLAYHSDHAHTRWGRRRPFLLAIAPMGCLAMFGVALSPALGGWTDAALGTLSPGLRHCRLGYFCLFWALFECAAISVLSLFTGLVNDVVPQHLLGRFYAGLRMLGLGAGIAFNTWVFALTDTHLTEILFAIGVGFMVPILLMCLMIREEGHAPAPAAALPARRTFLVPRARILECFAHRSYLWAVAAFMLASVTFNPFITFCQYYAQDSGISKATLGNLTAYGYMVSIASAFGVGWLVDHYGAVRVSVIVMGMYFVAVTSGYLLLHDGATFSVFYFAHVVLSGAYFTAAASLPMALFPSAQFVQYNSTKDLMVVLGNILVSSIQGPILDLSGHDYRLTLLSGAVFSILSIVCLARLRLLRTSASA
jgi:maltose/moltooligosaccharide transporter